MASSSPSAHDTTAASHSAASPGNGKLPLTGTKGPWGTLEYVRIPLQNSEEVFGDREARMKPTRWVFENYSAQQLSELLQSCELTAPQRAALLDTNHWDALTNASGYVISPSDEVVLGLSRSAKGRLYPALAKCQQNYPQCWPTRFPLEGFDQEFAESGLSPDRIEMLKSLTYTNQGYLCLCVDWPFLKSLPTNEFQGVIRRIYSVPTCLMRLRVNQDSDIDGLLKYWGKGGREKAIRPLLESLARKPNGGSINVACFFPPFAQMRLYTYPDITVDPQAPKEDCFYTALNFFNTQPDARYMDNTVTSKTLREEYHKAHAPPVFGDLITLIDAAGNGIHTCVYVADGVVFTKNGSNYLQPWVLMKFADMMTFFPSDEPPRMVIFRRNSEEESVAQKL